MTDSPDRIAVLSPALADQIAAGEVVERPASVVKELVENAVDAGARRIDIELTAAGLERILVCDDGRGIDPEDLPLALTRHATSKVRVAEDLVEVRTLGFRGEALASMAAVANITLESRPIGAKSGVRIRSYPGLAPSCEPVGMSSGTRVEVARLFANVPARRKFMRSESTEVGHCTETVLRLAVSHPQVHLRLQHNGRTLLDLVASDPADRMMQVLARRASCPLARFEARVHDVEVLALLGPVEAALRSRQGLFVVVRRRVVQHRELAQIVEAAYGDRLGAGKHPVACVVVDPPPGTVDVNVHPQKAEVRFSDPQRVYAALREVLRGFGAGDSEEVSEVSPVSPVRHLTPGTLATLDGWGRRAEPSGPSRRDGSHAAEGSGQGTYALRTRAVHASYALERSQLRDEAMDLHRRQQDVAREEEARHREDEAGPLAAGARSPTLGGPIPDATATFEQAPVPADTLTLLTCLPGPVAVFRQDDVLLAVDLRRLRSYLVYRRLCADLGGGQIAAQGLLEPVLVRLRPDEVTLLARTSTALERLGVVVEAFGDDALRVRAVPAQLRDCVDQPDVADLIARVLPWARLEAADPSALVEAMAQTRGADPAPRLARRWLRELVDQGITLASVPGVRRWSAEALLG